MGFFILLTLTCLHLYLTTVLADICRRLMVSGLLSFALLHIKRGTVKSWQALFILCGGMTSVSTST